MGLRDVMDDPVALAAEWDRKNAVPALSELYDSLWVYGLPEVCDPLSGIELPSDVREKMRYTGYLKRSLPKARPRSSHTTLTTDPYMLVMTGGGGDGDDLIDWVIRAYEQARGATVPRCACLWSIYGTEPAGTVSSAHQALAPR